VNHGAMAQLRKLTIIIVINFSLTLKWQHSIFKGTIQVLLKGAYLRYRYSKLQDCSPLEEMKISGEFFRFPLDDQSQSHPLKKPTSSKHYLIRFIRSGGTLDIFREKLPVRPETKYEFIVATIDVNEQNLKVLLDKLQIGKIRFIFFIIIW
jgi:hypothetical protein